YNKIDPDYRAGDLILNIDASAAAGTQAKVTTESSNLNIRKGPGTDQPIVGKAAHHTIVTVISRANDQWSLIRTDKGEEGYAYSQYLTQIQE
ncbi:MAG: SH3 domain-containing protein, partial [Sphingobacteriales bacterium]